jgi:hypothetical protein
MYAQIAGIDVPILLGNKELRLQIMGRKVDLAVDGYFLGSKERYRPFD